MNKNKLKQNEYMVAQKSMHGFNSQMCHDICCAGYLQKINFATVIKLLFLDVVEAGNVNENVI